MAARVVVEAIEDAVTDAARVVVEEIVVDAVCVVDAEMVVVD